MKLGPPLLRSSFNDFNDIFYMGLYYKSKESIQHSLHLDVSRLTRTTVDAAVWFTTLIIIHRCVLNQINERE